MRRHTTFLASLLGTEALPEFLNITLGRTYRFFPNPTSTFNSHLLSWDSLSQLLRHHQLDAPRFRLAREGKIVPADTYFSYTLNARQQRVPILQMAALSAQLRAGATLVFDSLDQLHEPVTLLCENLERDLQTPVWANAYAGWHASRGFDLHWDDHDVFILQIDGTKDWEIHGETERHPIIKAGQKPPSTGPQWKGQLNPGDILYIPRGWWHVAFPRNEPTLHLTVSFLPPTGLTLMQWIVEKLSEKELFRAGLPRLADQSAQGAHWDALHRELISLCAEPSLMDDFYKGFDGRAFARPLLSLPRIATQTVVPDSPHALIISRLPRGLEAHPGTTEGLIEIWHAGQVSTYDRGTEPLFNALCGDTPIPLGTFTGAFRDEYGEENLRLFLEDLAKRDIIAFREAQQ